MNFAKAPVLSDSLTNAPTSLSNLSSVLNAPSTALTNPLLQSSWQGKSGASAIAFIDASVSDYQTLVAGIASGTEVHILDSSRDAVTQITNTLLGRHNISSLHIVSHGEAGGLDFGTGKLNLSDLPEYAAQLKSWSNALTDNADILLYGCNVAQGELGKAFTNILSGLTGADVAASDDLTGSSAQGGDWTLEVNTGHIESTNAFNALTQSNYNHVLANFDVTNTSDSGLGSLRAAIDAANLLVGADTIVFTGSTFTDSTPDVIRLLSTLTITDSVTITGTGVNNLTISGDANNSGSNNSGDIRPFYISSGTVNLSDLTISGGRAQGGNGVGNGGGGAGLGGGIYIDNGNVTLQNITLSGNQAIGGNGGDATDLSGDGGSLGLIGISGSSGGSGGSGSGGSGGLGGLVAFNGSTGGSGSFASGGGGGGGGGGVLGIGNIGGNGGSGGLGGFGGGGGGGGGGGLGNGGSSGSGGLGGKFGGNGTSGSNGTTLNGGNAGSGGGGAGLGGGVFIRAGSLALNAVTFTNNSATGGAGGTGAVNGQGNGGAVFVIDSSSSNANGNNQGIPATVPTLTGTGLSFSGNTSTSNGNTTADNTSGFAPPIISINALSVSEGGSVVLSSSNLNTTDPDNTPAQLTYTATGVTSGQFELVSAPGTAITSFTQAQINTGAVRFVQNGSETAPSYSLSVSDGTLSSGSSTVTIGTFTPVNDAPIITTNALSISEGGSVVLSSSNLNATDPDNTPLQLAYTASNLSGGQFELVANAGVAITSFTQAQINAGAVRFVQNGSETAPSYSLSVSDGTLSSGSSTVTIGTFTPVNDAPTITTNALSVSEGGSVVLSSSNLNATDPDNTPAQLAYTASSLSGGQFELVANAGVAITSFTQAQINTGAVRFVQNGSETTPSYSLSVSDGSLSSGSSTVTIGTFTPVNDAPTITTNALSVSEGGSVVLSSSNLNTTDPDNTPAQLTYSVSGTPNGRFELVSAPGAAITSFTQAQVNSGAIQFVHNGGESPPAYSLSVSDGSLSSGSSTVTIGTFTPVNDAPTITTNALSVSEGGSVVLSSSNLNATDPDNTPAQLAYTASSLSGGQFELVANAGVAITSFTQAQINTGAVRFVQNGSETTPSYSLSVSDGSLSSGSSTVTIGTFTPVNDAPTITTNALSVSEGGSVVLSSSNLNTTDPDNTPAQLTYSVSGTPNGRFELVSAPGAAITSFTQAQVNSGAIQFVHNGGESPPAYSLSVSDGSLSSGSSTVTIGTFTPVNDAPTITTNALSVSEGGSVVLSSSNLNATDPDNTPAQLAYTASSLSGGQFELVANAGVAITSFTQAQINAGAVRFVQNGSETTPSYSLSVSDGSLSSGSSTVTIGTFTPVNDAPTLTGNATLAPVLQNTTNPSGTTLTSLFGSLFSDPDTGSSFSGLAIRGNTANTSTEGQWQYSTDGTTWASIGTVADGATALALSASSLVRFVPVGGYNGAPGGLTVRALDNTYSGGFSTNSTRVTVDTTTNGGTTSIAGSTTALNTSVAQSLPGLVWRNSSNGQNATWQLNNFTFQTGYYLPTVTDANWQIASSTADFNHDGIADLLWRNTRTGEDAIWQMSNTGYQTGYYIIPITDTNWQIVGTADFNNDNSPDLLWRNRKTGENAIWQMNGFSVQTASYITQIADTNWQIVGTADFTSDGRPDLLWRNSKTGSNAIWQMNGFSVQTASYLTPIADTNWQIVGTGNFNGDATPDLVWRNRATGENAIWQMNGVTLQSGHYISSLTDLNWQIAGVADLGGDSTPELLWRNQAAGKDMIWQLNGFSYSQTYQLFDEVPSWSVKPFVVI